MYINIRLLVAVFLVSNTKFVQCRDDKSVQSEGNRRLKLQNREIYEATDDKLRDYLGYYGNFISEKDRNWCPRECNSRTKILVSPNFSAYCTCNKNGKTVQHQCKKFEIFNSTTSACTPLLGNGHPTCVLRNRTCPSNRIGIEKHPNTDLYQNYIICMKNDVIVAKCKPNHYYKESQKSCVKIEGRKTVLSHSDCDEALKIKCTVPGITKLEDHPGFRQKNKCQNCYVICSEKDKNTFDLMIQCNKRKRILPFLYHQPINDIIKIPVEIDKTRHITGHAEPLIASENNKELIETTTILSNKKSPINKTEDGTNENNFEDWSHKTPVDSEAETFPGTEKYKVGPILIKKKPFIKIINNPTNVEETNEESDESGDGPLEKEKNTDNEWNKPKLKQTNQGTPTNNIPTPGEFSSNLPEKLIETDQNSDEYPTTKTPKNYKTKTIHTHSYHIHILKDDTPEKPNDDDEEADDEDIPTDALEELDERDEDLPDNLMETVKNEEPEPDKINKTRTDITIVPEETNSTKNNITESNDVENIENHSTEVYDKPESTENANGGLVIALGPSLINKPIIKRYIKKVYPKKKTTKKDDTVPNTSPKSKDHLSEIDDDFNHWDESPHEPIENENDLNKPKPTDTIYDGAIIGTKPILLEKPLIKKMIKKVYIKEQNPVNSNPDSDDPTEYTSSHVVDEKNSNEPETIPEDDSNNPAEEDSEKPKINKNDTTITIEIGNNKSNSPGILEDSLPEKTADTDYETSDDQEPTTETPNKLIQTKKDAIKPKPSVNIKLATWPDYKRITLAKINPKELNKKQNTPITDEDILTEEDEEPSTNSPDDKILTHDSDPPNPANNTNDLSETESAPNSEETELDNNGQIDHIPNRDDAKNNSSISENELPDSHNSETDTPDVQDILSKPTTFNDLENVELTTVLPLYNYTNNLTSETIETPDAGIKSEPITNKIIKHVLLKPKRVYLFHSPENNDHVTIYPTIFNFSKTHTKTSQIGTTPTSIDTYNKNKRGKTTTTKTRPPGITLQLQKHKFVDKEPNHYFEEEHPINFTSSAERPVKNKKKVVSLIEPFIKIVRKKPKKYLVKSVKYPKFNSTDDENFPKHHSILLRKPSKSIDGGHVLNADEPDNERENPKKRNRSISIQKHMKNPHQLGKKKRFAQRPIRPKIVKKVQNNEPPNPDTKNFILVDLGDVNNETILLEKHELDHDSGSSSCEVNKKDKPCPDKGFYRYKGSCSIHYECYYKKECKALVASRLYQCPHCLQFNAKKKRCDLPRNVPECTYHEEDEQKFKGHRLTVPVQACSGPGIFKDPGNPNRYYKCMHIFKDGFNYLTLVRCPPNQIFNDVLKKCVPGNKKQRANRRIIEGGHKKGSYVFDKYSCWRFFHNNGGPLIELHCPDGYVFNGKTCDNIKNSIFCNWDELKKYLYKR